MAKRSKKLRKKTKAKKTSAQKPGKGAKKGSSGGASTKTKGGGKKAGKVKKFMTVADLKRELERISSSLAALNAYFAKFPDAPAAGTSSGDITIGPQAIGDQCAPRVGDVVIGGPQAIGDQCAPPSGDTGIGNPLAIGDQCAPPEQLGKGTTNWFVFKRTLARMTVTVNTLIGMLSGLDPKARI
jgi:hypothetical protein